MSTQTPEATPRALEPEDVEALVDPRGGAVAVWLLWLIPAAAFLLALFRS